MKNFGIGLLCGGILGVVVGYLKNPNTGNTIKHDLKLQIDETIADADNIQRATAEFEASKNYLMTTGKEEIEQTRDFIIDRLDGFKMQIAPNIDNINEELAKLESDTKKLQDLD